MNNLTDITISPCNLCPRECAAARENGSVGFCMLDNKIRVARVSLHYWEEPCISGKNGSGTVFFSGCNLKCVYCQNEKISGGAVGRELTINELAEAFVYLQNKGAHNINLVTPTHFSTEIKSAIDVARERGLHLPIVYNTSGYEKPEVIDSLKGYVDIYLTDFKYSDNELAKRLSSAPDYYETAASALERMIANVGTPEFDEQGMLKRGVIVRQLLLPGHKKNSKAVIKYLNDNFKNQYLLSFMNQYTPCNSKLLREEYKDINRKVTKREYDTLVDYILELGIDNAYIQEGDTAKESFIPDFFDEDIWIK